MSSGTDKIVSSIMSEAQEKADVIIQEVNAEVSAIEAQADKTAEVEKAKILENGKKQSDMRYQQIISEAKMNARRAKLSAKEEIIEAAFEKAVSELEQKASSQSADYEDSLISVNDYLKDNNYNYLKERINIADNKKFINTDVIDLPNKLDKNYDIILLSNIQDYMKFTYHLDYLRSLEKYREFIKNDLMKYCNECIVGEYFYNNAAAPNLLNDASDETLYFDSINKLLSLTYDSTDDQVKIYKK